MSRIFNFVLVGGFNTLNSYVTFLISYRLTDSITLSLILAYIWSMGISYLLNKYFVFKSNSGGLIYFLIVNLTLLFLNRVILGLSVSYTSIPIELAQAGSLFILSVISYLSYSKIFQSRLE